MIARITLETIKIFTALTLLYAVNDADGLVNTNEIMYLSLASLVVGLLSLGVYLNGIGKNSIVKLWRTRRCEALKADIRKLRVS